MKTLARKIVFSLFATLPILLFAFSTGPVVQRTGAPADGGLTCSACHRNLGPANSDPSGSVAIDAANYTPGVKQIIKVTVSHPQAVRWGFQLTARLASDETKQAGSFETNDLVRVRCNTNPVHDAPCNGATEFPEHDDAPFTAAGAGFTFSVDWTPPATDVGDVMLYAAGNAANGDGNLTGDHIYTTVRTLQSTVCNLTGKPAIASALNAASFQASMAANAMISIFGRNLAGSSGRPVGAGDIVNHAFPKQLACVAVEIDGKRVPLSFVRADQINAQAPATPSLGPVPVRVILNPDRDNQSASDPVSVQMSAFAPAFFTLNGKTVAAQLANGDLVADSSVLPSGKFAKPGDMISLFGTGFGATTPAAQAGDVAAMASLAANPTIAIGGATLAASDIMYAGLAPGMISGLYQFTVKVPATAPDGDVPVSIQMGGAKTQDGTTIPIRK